MQPLLRCTQTRINNVSRLIQSHEDMKFALRPIRTLLGFLYKIHLNSIMAGADLFRSSSVWFRVFISIRLQAALKKLFNPFNLCKDVRARLESHSIKIVWILLDVGGLYSDLAS